MSQPRSAPDQRIHWEAVETFPAADVDELRSWEQRIERASSPEDQVAALVGWGCVSYWAVQQGVVETSWADLARTRAERCEAAITIARNIDDPATLAIALLGSLTARWGPDHLSQRPPIVAELVHLRDQFEDPELWLRIQEWVVLARLDRGDHDGVVREIERFTRRLDGAPLPIFERRAMLWRANLAMLEGRIDDAVRINEEAVSDTAELAGSQFAFQNLAVTATIERFFRRGLADVVGAVRSVLASSPRVAPNWRTGLCFSLSQIGESDEAQTIFDELAAGRFASIPRDVNWLVTIYLLGLTALALDDTERCRSVHEILEPFAEYDATHGFGYASYGPAGRVVGALAARIGHHDEAEIHFANVLTTRPDGPWTALARLDRARARIAAGRRLDGAHDDALAAGREFRRLALDEWAADADRVARELQLAGNGPPIALIDAGSWHLRHPTGAAIVADGVGMRHLVELLCRPGQSVNVFDLDQPADRRLPTVSTSEPPLDDEARRAYRTRLRQLAQQPDLRPAERAERDFLQRQLAGGTHYISVSAETERARVRVTKAIRRTIDHLADNSPGLGRHLRETIDTGRFCRYRPADMVPWTVRRRP